MRFDVAGLLQAEYQRMLAKKAAQRRKEIEAARSAPAEEAAPGFRHRSQLVRAGDWQGAPWVLDLGMRGGAYSTCASARR